MNFFDAQDSARRTSRRLVVAYVLATALIVAGVTAVVGFALYVNNVPPRPGILAAAAIAALLLIFGATLYRTATLSAGGGRVARELGGTLLPPDARDPLHRRLRNVVEEMAIASGVPVPEIYVLEQEAGINAFAAGFAPGDAAIAVTRGTLELLDRDELQGVVAHEFSHVLNGDMRLGIRMMGVLYGIMVLGLIGRLLLRGSRRSRRGSSAGLVLGLGLVVLGSIGVYIARLLKAAVSRQRELLADASAVQFTRQTDGIANALKKIAGFDRKSYLTAADPEEVSHMLFALGAKLSSLFATHPPLIERIRRLEPGFRPEDVPRVEMPAVEAGAGEDSGMVAGFASGSAGLPPLEETIGNPTMDHVEFAGAMRSGLPASLYEAAHSTHSSWLLIIALFVDREGERGAHARELLTLALGADRCRVVARFVDELGEGERAWRLPLLEIAFPSLKAVPAARIEYLLDLCGRLIEMDGRITLYEFCLYRLLRLHLGEALSPGARRRPASKRAAREAALTLLAVVAQQGHDEPEAQREAFAAGQRAFGRWAEGAGFDPPEEAAAALADSIDTLQRTGMAARRTLVRAVGDTVSSDGRLGAGEAELLRAICGSLDCPLPPLAARNK